MMRSDRERQKIYELIIYNLPVGFSMVDREGLIVDFNEAAEKITGYSKNDVIGKSHFEILHGTRDTAACPLVQIRP